MPCAPVAPVAPVAPSEPFVPLVPSAPATPVAPVAPSTPFVPLVPSAPATPVAPVAPATPVAPVAPEAPFAPFVPFVPAAPVAPVAPGAPVAPVGPVAPVAPVPAVQSSYCSFFAQPVGAWPFFQERLVGSTSMIRTVPRCSPREPSMRTQNLMSRASVILARVAPGAAVAAVLNAAARAHITTRPMKVVRRCRICHRPPPKCSTHSVSHAWPHVRQLDET